MHTTPRLLDVVALLSDVPARGLLRGQVGTVVELLDSAYEVEFSDEEGKTYAELALWARPAPRPSSQTPAGGIARSKRLARIYKPNGR
jgi:hypothetical protein